MKRLVFDIETNGFKPSEIYCIGIHNLDTGIYQHYVLDDVIEGLLELVDADVLIGHNIRGFDVPVIERLTEGLVTIPQQKIIDTLDLSRDIFGETMKSHKLAVWGELLGYPKLDWNKFDRFYLEMVPYMDRDVEINVKLYEFFMVVLEQKLQDA